MGPKFEYETGPDGKQYAVGGEVSIDTSEVQGDPQATIAKMKQVQRAASAPAEPSSHDRAVATQARATEQKARAELAEQRRELCDQESGVTRPQAPPHPRPTTRTASTPTAATPNRHPIKTDRSSTSSHKHPTVPTYRPQ
ncbi:MAG: putative metalloprotease CJM1_0395 family protein [Planctomycetota bacterium]